MWARGAGGEKGIRTLETVPRLHTFQACAFDHSAISPHRLIPGLETPEGSAGWPTRARRNILMKASGARDHDTGMTIVFVAAPSHLVSGPPDMAQESCARGGTGRPASTYPRGTGNFDAAYSESSGHLADRPGAGLACYRWDPLSGGQCAGFYLAGRPVDANSSTESGGCEDILRKPVLCRPARCGAEGGARLSGLRGVRRAGHSAGACRSQATA